MFVFFSNSIFSQYKEEIDSLKALLKIETVDTLQVNHLNDIAFKFYRNIPDSGIFYGNKALKQAEKLNYFYGLSRSNRVIGLAYAGKSDYTGALDYLYKALDYAGKAKDISIYASTLTSIGIVYRKLSEYDKALKYYLSSLSLVRIEGNPKKISSALNNVGIIYKVIGDYDEAIKYYTESLEINQKIKYNQGISFNLANLGMLYKDKKDYKNSELFFNQALDLFEEFNYKNEIAHVYLALGEINSYRNDYNEAFDYIQKANKIYSETENLSGTAETYIILGEIYYNQNKLTAAESAINLGLKISKQIEYKEFIIESYYYLSKIDSMQSNYKGAFENFQKYTFLKDSIFSKEKNNTIAIIKEQYLLAEKDRENELLRKNKELQGSKLKRQKTVNSLTFVILALSVIVLFLFIYSYRRVKNVNKELSLRNDEIQSQNGILLEYKEKIQSQYEEISKQNEKLEEYKTQLELLVEERTEDLNVALSKAQKSDKLKTQFLRNLSHEVRTPMNAVIGLTDLLNKNTYNFKPEYVYGIQKGMDDLLNTIERLVLFSKFQVESYEIKKEPIVLRDFFKAINEKAKTRKEFLKKNDIEINFNSNYELLPKQFVTDEYLFNAILSEVTENAFKFTEKGTIDFDISYNSDERKLCVKIKDSGVGIKEEMISHVYDFMRKFDKENLVYRGMGVGLAIVKKAVDLMNGDVKIDSVYKEGAEMTIIIPEAEMS